MKMLLSLLNDLDEETIMNLKCRVLKSMSGEWNKMITAYDQPALGGSIN